MSERRVRKIRAPQSHAAPVWCLPVAAGPSAVWAGAPLGAEMTALEAEGTACEIIGRRRLIGGRATLHIMLAAGPRDGAASPSCPASRTVKDAVT